jgi:hypothetical protein
MTIRISHLLALRMCSRYLMESNSILLNTIKRVHDAQCDIVRAIKSKLFRWMGHNSTLGGIRNAYRILGLETAREETTRET